MDTELADLGTIDQTLFVQQVHPIIEAHPHQLAIRQRQIELITPVEGKPLAFTHRLPHHIGSSTSPVTVNPLAQIPGTGLLAAIIKVELLEQLSLAILPTTHHIDTKATGHFAAAVGYQAVSHQFTVEETGEIPVWPLPPIVIETGTTAAQQQKREQQQPAVCTIEGHQRLHVQGWPRRRRVRAGSRLLSASQMARKAAENCGSARVPRGFSCHQKWPVPPLST